MQPEFSEIFNFKARFDGGSEAKHHQVNLYDLSVSLRGIHRTFTIIGNFIQTDEIITRVPDAKGISILTQPIEKGSIALSISIAFSAAIYAMSQSKESVLGHLTWSCYDYLVKKATGKHVDPDKSLFYTWYSDKGDPTPRIASLIHKTESALLDMHRPIITKSADILHINPEHGLGITLDSKTYDAINNTHIYPDSTLFCGRTSSYNANTQSGMIYVDSEQRAIPFEFDKDALIDATFIARSLSMYTRSKHLKSRTGFFEFQARKVCSSGDYLKKLIITNIYANTLVK